jgi:HTH-type transcriptional regulator, osmoprotectant uptake regulator
MKKEVKKENILDSEFSDICISVGKYYGLEDFPCRIFSILYLEPKEISLDEIAKKTGYSLSTVSKTMKSLEHILCLNKFRKPHSKKVFFSMEKDMGKWVSLVMKKKLESIETLKEGLPHIIKKYDSSVHKDKLEKIKLLKSLHKHVVFMDKALKIVIKMKGG